MNIKKAQLIFLLAILLQSAAIFTAHAQVTKISNGILVKTGDTQVGLLAAKNAAFCLSLNGLTTPSMLKSTFIDEGDSANTPYTIISAAPTYGIKTAYGKLMINTDTKVWSLYDAAGRVLISDGAYSFADSTLQITYSADGRLYGSGNKSSKELEKNQSANTIEF